MATGNINLHTVHHQKGVGMIEVLVTLFILSIGILGVASMQFVSSFSNSDALNRSQSVMVAQYHGHQVQPQQGQVGKIICCQGFMA